MAVHKAAKAEPTVEEIVALLKKTDLPTVVCEGADDLIVYRRLEEALSHIGLSVLPAGGREKVLQIFDRRAEIPHSVGLVFIADRDTWVNTAVPAAYVSDRLCLTTGYSIENDVIADGDLESLLVGADLASYKRELQDFLDWYALALNRHLANKSSPIALHPDYVLNSSERATLMALNSAEVYPAGVRAALSAGYGMLVRGKSLLALLLRNTNSRIGLPKHTDKALLESVAARPGPLLGKLSAAVEAALVVTV